MSEDETTLADLSAARKHESQPPISLQRMFPMKLNDGFFFPGFQPEVSGNPAVVLVHAPIPLLPLVELARPNPQPCDEPPDAHLGLLRPAPNEVHQLVLHIVRHPALG